jgi:hypothetical protein
VSRRLGGELAKVSPHLAWAWVELVDDVVSLSVILLEEIPEQDHEQNQRHE